jgi:hypothetical protein
MEAYIHGVSMTMCNIMVFQCVSMGGLRWVSIWGLRKHVHSTTYHNCHILHVHESNYFQQI